MNHKLESKIAERNINNLRYPDNTTLMAKSKEELQSFSMKVKEESEIGCVLNHSVMSNSLQLHGL